MSFRRQIDWTAACRTIERDRAAPADSNAMFLASMERARAITARKAALAAQTPTPARAN